MPNFFTSLSPTARGYFIIHFCVILWGFTPIMGRLIDLAALELVWWRMLFACAALLLLPATWRGWHKFNLKYLGYALMGGFLLASTWMLFYVSVKATNASVAAVCIAATPLFLSFFGPLVTKRRYKLSDLFLAIIVVPGMLLVVGGIPSSMLVGLGYGILASAVLALFSSSNRLLTGKVPPLTASCLIIGFGAVFVLLTLFIVGEKPVQLSWPQGNNLILLLVLAVLMTALPMVLVLIALRHLSVFAQQNAINLEPLYALLLAIPILGEAQELSWQFYVGSLIIVGTVFLEPWFTSMQKKRQLKTNTAPMN